MNVKEKVKQEMREKYIQLQKELGGNFMRTDSNTVISTTLTHMRLYFYDYHLQLTETQRKTVSR